MRRADVRYAATIVLATLGFALSAAIAVVGPWWLLGLLLDGLVR